MSTLTAQATVGPGMWQGMPSASCGACSALTASRWHSNNSVFATLGMDYGPVVDKVVKNGEPGFAWLENMQQFSRMRGEPDHKDHRAGGGNPCLEQTLESYELCCLVETFPSNHESFDDFRRTLKVCARACVALLSLCTTGLWLWVWMCVCGCVWLCVAATLMRGGMQCVQYAYLYAKTVTLGTTHWPATNRVMLRNRRIGCSLSGIAQFVASKGGCTRTGQVLWCAFLSVDPSWVVVCDTGLHNLQQWAEDGYDAIQHYDKLYSDWLAIPRSIKTTCIKPSGTVSLVAGCTWP